MKYYKLMLAVLVMLSVAVVPAHADWSANNVKVMIDPGHGGSDPGAGRSGYRYEGDLVLDCSLAMRDWLKAQNCDYRLTRETNTTLSLDARRQMSITYDPWVFCSVHLNAYNGEAYGTEVWYYWSDRSPQLAQFLQDELHGRFQRYNRGVKQEAWTVITGASYIPAVLTESLFVDNPTENNMINSRDKQGFKDWVNGHLQGFYRFMMSAPEVNRNGGSPNLTDPSTAPWGGGGSSVTPPSGVTNPAHDPDWQAKDLTYKNVFAYDIRVNRDDILYPKVSYRLNGLASEVKVRAYMNGRIVAEANGTGNNGVNTITLDLSNVRERGNVSFKVYAKSARVVDKPTLVKDQIPPAWTNWYRIKFFLANGVTVNNCTDSPTFGRIVVAEDHENPYSGFVSSTGDNHGRGAMLYPFTPQLQPIPNPHLPGTWGFSAAMPMTGTGSFSSVRYTDDGRLFFGSADADVSKRGVYEVYDTDADAASLNGMAKMILKTDYAVTGFDVKGSGDDLRIVATGFNNMVYTPNSDGWYALPFDATSVPKMQLHWPNRNQTQDINMGNYGFGHVDCHTLKVAFDPDGQGFMMGNARIAPYPDNTVTPVYPIYHHVTVNGQHRGFLAAGEGGWENMDGGVAVYSADGKFFVMSGSKGELIIQSVSDSKTDGRPNMSHVGGIYSPDNDVNEGNCETQLLVGSSTRDAAFDYAGNIYIVGDNSRKDLSSSNYKGQAGMVCFQLPASLGGKPETEVPAPSDQNITDFTPKGVKVQVKEVVWDGRNSQKATIYWDDMELDGQAPTGYTVLLNGQVYGDNSRIWSHSYDNPYNITLAMYRREAADGDLLNNVQVIPYYNGTAANESNVLRIGHTPYYSQPGTYAVMENGADGQQPVTVSWDVPAEADVYGYRLFRIIDGKSEQINCPGDKKGIFPAGVTSYRMADAGIRPCTYRVEALMDYRLCLQNAEISESILGRESAQLTPDANKTYLAPVITELINYEGRNSVRLSWSYDDGHKPDYYIVERDGIVIVDRGDYNSTIDMLVPDGMHTYKVTAVYGNVRVSSEPAPLLNPVHRDLALSQYGIEEVYNYPIMSEGQFAGSGRTYQNTIVPRNDRYFTEVPSLNNTGNTSIRNFMMGESLYGAVGGLYRHGSYRNGYWYIAQLTNKSAVQGTTANMPDGYINYWDGTDCSGGVIRFNADDPLANSDFDAHRPKRLFGLEHGENQWVAADDGDGNWVNLVTRRRGDNGAITFFANTNSMFHAYYNTGTGELGFHSTGSDYINNKYNEHSGHPNPSSGGSVNGQNVRVHYVSANGNIGGTGGYVFMAMCNMPGVLRQYWDGGYCKSEEYLELPRHLGPDRNENGLIASPENYAFPVEGRPRDFILQLRSHGYFYYNDATGQYIQIMGENEAKTAGGITFTYNGETFLVHPSSNSSNNTGHFRIDMPQRPTQTSPATDADFSDLIPMATFTQRDVTSLLAQNSNGMWFGFEPAPDENCIYIYQYVPGMRMAKYRFYCYDLFPPVSPTMDVRVVDDGEKITHFEVSSSWKRPAVHDYEFNDRTDYRIDRYDWKILDANMNVVASGSDKARDGSDNIVIDFAKGYGDAWNNRNVTAQNYTMQVQPFYQRVNGGNIIPGEVASVQARTDYPASVDELVVRAWKDKSNDLYRVDFDFDRADMSGDNYPNNVTYFDIQMQKYDGGPWISVPNLRIMHDGVVKVQAGDPLKSWAGIDPEIYDGRIPGLYKFGDRNEPHNPANITDKAFAKLKPEANATPSVAYALFQNENPTQYKFRAVAHYAADNSYISKDAVTPATTAIYQGTTGIDDVMEDSGVTAVRVYPVPADTEITVESPEAITAVRIYSVTGAEVMRLNGNGTCCQRVNISHLAAGTYMLGVNGLAPVRMIKF